MALKLADRVYETSTTTGTGTLNLAGAASGYQTFVAGVGTGNAVYYSIAHQSASEWEVGIGTVTSGSPDTLSRTKVLASSNSGSAVNFSSGTKDVFLTAPASILMPELSAPGGRLTTESGVAVSTTDRTAQGTLYYTPYKSSRIWLYNGSSWQMYNFSELSLSLTLTSGKNYDVFVYDNAGTLTLELSAAWTSDTARNDALATQDGVVVKSGATTRRWLGTIRASGTNVTADSAGGTTTQVGGQRFVWNAYNQVPRRLAVMTTTSSWNYGTGTIRQAEAASGNKVEWVSGIAELMVQADVKVTIYLKSNFARGAAVGIGLDSTTVFSGPSQWPFNVTTSDLIMAISGAYAGQPGLGYHYLSWNESGADGTSQFRSGAVAVGPNSGMLGWLMG